MILLAPHPEKIMQFFPQCVLSASRVMREHRLPVKARKKEN